MAERLFVSHASEDAALVRRIIEYLESHGTACWFAPRDIPAKSIYADEITEAMQACSACAVVLSAASNESKAVKRELELASHYDKPFIPIRIDETEIGRGYDYYLRNTQWENYARSGDEALDRIVMRMSGSLQAVWPFEVTLSGDVSACNAIELALASTVAWVVENEVSWCGRLSEPIPTNDELLDKLYANDAVKRLLEYLLTDIHEGPAGTPTVKLPIDPKNVAALDFFRQLLYHSDECLPDADAETLWVMNAHLQFVGGKIPGEPIRIGSPLDEEFPEN